MAEATAGGIHARGICGRHDQGRRVAAVLLFLAIIDLAPQVALAQELCIPPLDTLKRAMCSDPELRGGSKSDNAASIFSGRCSRRHSNSNSPPITVLGERRSPRVADWQIFQDYLWSQP